MHLQSIGSIVDKKIKHWPQSTFLPKRITYFLESFVGDIHC